VIVPDLPDHIFQLLEVNPQDKSIMIIEKNYKNNYVEFLYGRKEEVNNTTLPENIRENLIAKEKIEYINYDKYINYPRRELATLLFDSFGISRIYFSNGEVLSLYANNMVTGIVVNIGSSTTRMIPVFQGFIVIHAISIRNIGTKHVIENILDHLNIRNEFKEISQHLVYLIHKRLRLATEENCYLSLDLKTEKNKWHDNEKLKKYINLYDDKYVILDDIRYIAPEILFDKVELSTSKKKGTLVDAIIETVQKSDIDTAKNLYGNILLTGGGSLYSGLEERLAKELREKIPKQLEARVISKQNRLISSWIGGSILACLESFEKRNLWVTKAEYDEKGSSAVDRCI